MTLFQAILCYAGVMTLTTTGLLILAAKLDSDDLAVIDYTEKTLQEYIG